MPCWTKVSSKIELKNPNRELLEKALAELGYKISTAEYAARFDAILTADNFDTQTSVILKADGTVTLTGARAGAQLGEHVNALKRSYAAQVVEASARKFGWQVAKKEEGRFQLVRRY